MNRKLQSAPRKRNLFGGLLGGRRREVTLEEVEREKQRASDEACRRGDPYAAIRIRKQTASGFARSRGWKLLSARAERRRSGNDSGRRVRQAGAEREERESDLSEKEYLDYAAKLAKKHKRNPADKAMLRRVSIKAERLMKEGKTRPRAFAEAFEMDRAGRLTPAAKYLRAGRAGRRNPGDAELGQATVLYREFIGKTPAEVIEGELEIKVPTTYTQLSPQLCYLDVKTPNGKERIEFDDSEEHVQLVSDPKGQQLYFLGGNQDIRLLLRRMGLCWKKRNVELGPCTEIAYLARKAMDGFELIEYYHAFAEDDIAAGEPKPPRWPRLCFDQDNCRLFFVGGAYRVEAPGIIN